MDYLILHPNQASRVILSDDFIPLETYRDKLTPYKNEIGMFKWTKRGPAVRLVVSYGPLA